MVYVVLAVLGLCFGSFVNALVWRIHEQQHAKSKAKKAKLSITRGRSMCVHCGHELVARDLLPVISWISLGGKCRYCRKSISWQYPLVELITAALFVISYAFWPFSFQFPVSSFQFLLWLVLLTGFMALAVYDLRWYILPDRVVFPLQGLAALFAVIQITSQGDAYGILQAFGALLATAGFFWVLHTVSKGKWIGYGDVKLAVVLALVLGRLDLALLMLFISSCVGSIVAIPLLITGKAHASSRLPFGPFLILGTFVTFLFGASMIGWYSTQLLLV